VTGEHEGDQHSSTGATATTRRSFLQLSSAAALSALFPRGLGAQVKTAAPAVTFNPALLTPADEIWGWLEKMVKDGPRFTGSPSHKTFVDFLASGMQGAGLTVGRDPYTFTRWVAKKWGLKAAPKGAAPVDIPVTSYYPHSGNTGPAGVTGALTYVGKMTTAGGPLPGASGDLKGKIVLIDYEVVERDYGTWYTPWGFHTPDTKFPSVITSIIAVATPLLTEYQKAGAAGAIIVWTNLSDAHATDQHLPFGRPLQEVPTLYVGRDAGAKLKQMAQAGATATLTLDADVLPKPTTDTIYATLPGATSDEIVMVTTHTDGANVVQENGGLGLLTLARYFSKIPQGSRQRTLVFALTTGHYAGAYVPSIRGFMDSHPDIIKKTVASLTIEHLGCREWLDDRTLTYAATGKDDMCYAVAERGPMGKLMVEALQGSGDRRVGVGKPTPKGRYLGEGGNLSRAGIPAIGYFAGPTYLNMAAADGCISKLSKPHIHAQIGVFAKLLHKIDVVSTPDLKGPAPTSQQ
jgi:hypothetical protein